MLNEIEEKVAGYIPAAKDKLNAVLNFLKSGKGKTIAIVVAALVVVGFAHHAGVVGQRHKTAEVQQQLDLANAALRASVNLPKSVCPPNIEAEHAQVAPNGWLAEQVKANAELQNKVKKYETELAKRKQPAGDALSDADARRLLRIH
jgi:hypothetical protein